MGIHWPWRRRKAAEIDPRHVLLPLSPAHVGQGGYDRSDRAGDFRAVFILGGATEMQRERVLFQILTKCGIHYLSADDDNDRRTYLAEGRRDVGLWLMARLHEEPQPGTRPTRTEGERYGES